MKTLTLLLVSLSALAQKPALEDYQISGIIVDHLTSHPLNHVLVEITRMGKGGGDASVLTEADGRFTFLHVPKGKYNLQAQKRGQFPQGYHSSDGGYATAIVVDGNLKTDGIIFPLRTDSSINGVITGDDGEAVRNAQVHLFRESVNDGEAQTSQLNTVVTNSAGQFHFGHLEPAKYYLAASGVPWYDEGGMNRTVYPVTFYGDTTDADAARSVTLTEGAAASVEITLHAVPGIHVKLPNNRQNVMLAVPGPGGTQIPVPTSVVGTAGQTELVRSRSQSNGGFISMPELQQGTDVTSYELVNVPAGRYQVSSFGQNGEQNQSTKTVDLTNGSTLSLDNGTATPSEVTGRIIFDSPRPDGELSVFLGGGRRGMTAAVAADGTFKFDKLSAGKFDLNVNLMAITSIEARGARLAHDHLEVPSGASVELIIHVQSAETLASIEGFAVQAGTGVAGAMVLLIPQDLQRVRLMRRDQSDGDGSFSLANVLPGRYTLVAIDDGHNLAYKDEKIIKPYLEGGLSITVPLRSNDALKVPVQTRRP